MPHRLDQMPVLAVDCQSTGASPKHGHLLELAWCRFSAAEDDPEEVASFVLRLPDDEQIPRRIQRMTGIGEEDVAAGLDPADAWRRLQDAYASAARAVIHYARFEKAFLNDAHERFTPDAPFPLDIVCTHGIASRLFPELPRRGIRALAGYLGHPMDEDKRAEHHARATAFIWRETVRELSLRGVDTLDELGEWMRETSPKRRGGKGYAIDRAVRLSLPERPGVYRMLGKTGNVLYVGKATSLKRRVNTYFQTRRGLSSRKLELVTQIWDVDVTPTASPLEAALLETDQIKHHSPPYNRALRARHRELSFANRAGTDFAADASDAHRVGPLRSTRSLRLASALRAPDSLLDWVEDDAPDRLVEALELLDEGRRIFWERHPDTDLRRLAAELHRRRRLEREAAAEAEDDDDGEDDAEAPESDEEFVWTAELVADLLEDSLRRAHRGLRKSRWLCRLTDAAIAWRRGDEEGRLLILDAGEVAEAGEWDGGELPTPAGSQRSFAERQRCFDLSTWDRLRVLTTELKRLVGEEAAVKVRFGARAELENGELARLFEWI